MVTCEETRAALVAAIEEAAAIALYILQNGEL
jgi:hypothetical protein